MYDQEYILKLILAEDWGAVINILHNNRSHIWNDSLMAFAASTFESEFLRKVNEYTKDRTDIKTHLEDLYVLHKGNFYKLSDENYKRVLEELSSRTAGSDALNYVYELKRLSNTADQTKVKNAVMEGPAYKRKIQNIESPIVKNWIEIYNRLFELINDTTNNATYFSGPKFISVVKQFKPYHADYSQYIEKRNLDGKSTSRKIFFYDILNEQDTTTRQYIVNRILDLAQPFEKNKVAQIKLLMGEFVPESNQPLTESQQVKNAESSVFISYSWDDENHKAWVLKLADELSRDGIFVILDRYELRAGKSIPHFVEQSIAKADKILIIFTPNYKLKADKRNGGVGYEYSIMNVSLYQNQTNNEKVIPILRSGSQQDSIPTFMQQFIHLDMTRDENYDTSYVDLKREICDQPVIQRPKPNKSYL